MVANIIVSMILSDAKIKKLRGANKKNSLLIKANSNNKKTINALIIVLLSKSKDLLFPSSVGVILIAEILPNPKLRIGATKLKKCKKI